jgi:hypothetical protein
VLLFALTSFTIGGLTGLQAGAKSNYFFESLLALTPFAVLGVLRLTVWARVHFGAALFVAGLFAIHFLPTSAHELHWAWHSGIGSRSIESRNEAFRTMQNALQGRHIFSTVPRLALLDPNPALMEPFLLSYLRGAIMASYTPYCVLPDFEIYLPRYCPEDKTLVRNLEGISCVPVPINEPGAAPN